MLSLDRLDPPNAGGDHTPDPPRLIRRLVLPSGLRQRLPRGDDRQLREPVQPPDLLDRQEILWLEVSAGARAVDDAAFAPRPPFV